MQSDGEVPTREVEEAKLVQKEKLALTEKQAPDWRKVAEQSAKTVDKTTDTVNDARAWVEELFELSEG